MHVKLHDNAHKPILYYLIPRLTNTSSISPMDAKMGRTIHNTYDDDIPR